jgi:Lrp/AsnC family leucine-responsive transcriptional regulator
MDEIDRKILLAVQADGAAGLAEIAKIAGLSVSATAERQKRLEERGLIRGWHAALDPPSSACRCWPSCGSTSAPARKTAPSAA